MDLFVFLDVKELHSCQIKAQEIFELLTDVYLTSCIFSISINNVITEKKARYVYLLRAKEHLQQYHRS